MNFESQLTYNPASNLIKVGNVNLADGMNDLLSDYNIFNQNVKGFHWNFIGPDVFNLHQKFENLNERLTDHIEKLAYGIVGSGFVPLHSYSDYLKYSNHKEINGVNSDYESVTSVIDGLRKLIGSSLNLVAEARKAKDNNSEIILNQLSTELENELWVFTMLAKY